MRSCKYESEVWFDSCRFLIKSVVNLRVLVTGAAAAVAAAAAAAGTPAGASSAPSAVAVAAPGDNPATSPRGSSPSGGQPRRRSPSASIPAPPSPEPPSSCSVCASPAAYPGSASRSPAAAAPAAPAPAALDASSAGATRAGTAARPRRWARGPWRGTAAAKRRAAAGSAVQVALEALLVCHRSCASLCSRQASAASFQHDLASLSALRHLRPSNACMHACTYAQCALRTGHCTCATPSSSI